MRLELTTSGTTIRHSANWVINTIIAVRGSRTHYYWIMNPVWYSVSLARKSEWQDSNLRPSEPKSDAPTKLRYTPKIKTSFLKSIKSQNDNKIKIAVEVFYLFISYKYYIKIFIENQIMYLIIQFSIILSCPTFCA